MANPPGMMPIYVTRPMGNGARGHFMLSPRFSLLVFLLIVGNILGWSIFGLVALTMKAVEYLG